jgi:hypothetical protein
MGKLRPNEASVRERSEGKKGARQPELTLEKIQE